MQTHCFSTICIVHRNSAPAGKAQCGKLQGLWDGGVLLLLLKRPLIGRFHVLSFCNGPPNTALGFCPRYGTVCEGQSGLQRRFSRIRKIWRGGLAAYKRKTPRNGFDSAGIVACPWSMARHRAAIPAGSKRAQRHTQRSACGISKGPYCQFGCRVGAGASRKDRLSAGS